MLAGTDVVATAEGLSYERVVRGLCVQGNDSCHHLLLDPWKQEAYKYMDNLSGPGLCTEAYGHFVPECRMVITLQNKSMYNY